MSQDQADAWSAVFEQLLKHNREFTNKLGSGLQNALDEIKRLQALDTQPGIYVGEATDAGIANRVRNAVRGLQVNLAEAKKRGIRVTIAVGYNVSLQWPAHYMHEGDQIEVTQIIKTSEVKL